MINVLQVGMGPLGVKIAEYILEKESMQTVAAVDLDSKICGRSLSSLSAKLPSKVIISKNLSAVLIHDIDIAILTTSSSMESITPQIENILDCGIPVVSTCEELTYPWQNDEELANRIDAKAKQKGVAVVSTGVNPGFLMDALPSMLTAVCKKVDHITVSRIQDASSRRLPFQQKIGAGLGLDQFQNKVNAGSLRHVGLTESMQFIADAVGWELDHVEDVISPIVAVKMVETDKMKIPEGFAQGVKQLGRALSNGEEKIKLVFEAAVGTGISYDEIKITGQPNIHSRIEGGVHGDVATCSIVLNVIPKLIKCTPGLKTMGDLPIVSFTS